MSCLGRRGGCRGSGIILVLLVEAGLSGGGGIRGNLFEESWSCGGRYVVSSMRERGGECA